jgi:hypothetical protein
MLRLILALCALLAPACALVAQPPKTDQYGDPLPTGAIARLGTTRWRVGQETQFVGFPDDHTLVTVSFKYVVQVWERDTGRELRRHDLRTTSVGISTKPPRDEIDLTRIGYDIISLSGDGKRLAVPGADRQIYFWLFSKACG